MPEEFYRIKRLPPYVFAEVNALKAQARAAGRDVIDLGMGNPDGPTPPHIVAKLIEAVQNPKTHGYSSSRGIAGLRRAVIEYHTSVIGHGILISELEARMRRVEQHLDLPALDLR